VLPPDRPADVLPAVGLGWLSFRPGRPSLAGGLLPQHTVAVSRVATLNSLAHLAGDQPFRTDDHSRNTWA